MFKDDGEDFTPGEVTEEIERLARVEGDHVRIRRGEWVPIKKLLSDWQRVLDCIPKYLIDTIKGQPLMKGYSPVALRMMRNLGWLPGTGLGLRTIGPSEPITAQSGQSDRKGLGLRPIKRPNKSKKEGLIALWRSEGIVYGRREGLCLRVHSLSIKGYPSPTPERIYFEDSEVREVQWWKGGVMGIAESSFPNPKEWRYGDIDKTLDRITVKDLTGAFTRIDSAIPSCIKKWTEIFGELNFLGISERYSTGIISPKDYMPHFKLIMHRALFTNPHNPQAGTDMCRLCGVERESIAHFGKCTCLKPIFEQLRRVDGGVSWDDQVLNLFGHNSFKGIVPPGISMIHFIVWKFILISMTQLSLENKPFVPAEVLKKAKARIKRKIEVARYNLEVLHVRARARGQDLKAPQYRKWTRGIGEIEDNKIVLYDSIVEWIIEDT